MPRKEDLPDRTETGLLVRGTASSFCGGAGGSSVAGAALLPSGPKGPKESSNASSVVDCVPKRRAGRGPLLAEGFVVVGLDDSFFRGAAGVDSSTKVSSVFECSTSLSVLFVAGLSCADAARLVLDCDLEGSSAGLIRITITHYKTVNLPPQGESSSISKGAEELRQGYVRTHGGL